MNVCKTLHLFTVSVVYQISDYDFHVFDKGNDNDCMRKFCLQFQFYSHSAECFGFDKGNDNDCM